MANAEIELVGPCPLCGASDRDEILEQPDALFPTRELRLSRCCGCGLVFLDPRMSFLAMQKLEDASTIYAFDPSEIEHETSARVGLVQSLSIWPRRKETLLDVGCNRGLLLTAAQRLGWAATGVEISPDAATHARSETGAVVYESLDDIPEGSRFDLVFAWHVVEHTSDPVAFVRRLGGLLEPSGGVVAIQVPSYDFVDEFRARDQLGSIICAVHNFYFTEESVRQVVHAAGLKILMLSNSPEDLMLTVIAASGTRSVYRTFARRVRRRLRRYLRG